MVTRSQTKALQAQLNNQLHANTTVTEPDAQLEEIPVVDTTILEEQSVEHVSDSEVQEVERIYPTKSFTSCRAFTVTRGRSNTTTTAKSIKPVITYY